MSRSLSFFADRFVTGVVLVGWAAALLLAPLLAGLVLLVVAPFVVLVTYAERDRI